MVLQRNVYDGFDRVIINRTNLPGAGGQDVTNYTYDPLDRTTNRIEHVGTASQKNTTMSYMGLSDQIVDEQVGGQVQKNYQSTPWGELLSQTKHNTDGTTEDAFYGYDPHSSVEDLTSSSGDTKATYGYTAFGKDDDSTFTGVDKPDPADPTKEPYNFYRYTAKRFDPANGTYDLGFRNYDPGLNRFLTRDLYNGALDDLDLATDPFTNNRYTFASGNPTTMVDLTGHTPTRDNMVSANPALNVEWNAPSASGVNAAEYAASREAGASPSGGVPPSRRLPPAWGFSPGVRPSSPPSLAEGLGKVAAAAGTALIAGLVIVVGSVGLGGDTPEGAKPDVDVKQDRERDCLYGDSTKSTYHYSDNSGRAGTATACLVAPLKQATRPPRGRNAPKVPGHTPGVTERSHLIGRQLGGSGRRENLVPMYPAANDPGMTKYEDYVREKVEAGMRVWYEVSPVYDGDEPVPTSIRIRAVGRMPDWAPGKFWADVRVRSERRVGRVLTGHE